VPPPPVDQRAEELASQMAKLSEELRLKDENLKVLEM